MKPVATITILDEINLRVLGMELADLHSLRDEFSFFTEGYKYSIQYKLGVWDGKTEFFTKKGYSYVFMLPQLVRQIIARGYGIEMLDNRSAEFLEPTLPITADYFSHIINPKSGLPYSLAPHQIEGANIALAEGTGILLAGTGFGKTILNAVIIDAYASCGARTITIVPSSSLVVQTVEQFKVLQLDVGRFDGDIKDPDHTHLVTTWQSLQNHPIHLRDRQMLVTDECFAPGTLITMADSTYKPIECVVPGDRVITYNEAEGRFTDNVVIKQHIGISQAEQMYEIEMDNGAITKVTGNHKFLTTIGYVRADELTIDHDIIGEGDMHGI